MKRNVFVGALLVFATAVAGAPREPATLKKEDSGLTPTPLDRSPDTSDETPPSQTIPFPFPLTPFRPEMVSQQSGFPFPFTLFRPEMAPQQAGFPFPFLFPSFAPASTRPISARASDPMLMPLNDEILFFSSEEDSNDDEPEMQMRRSPTSDKKPKQPKKKKKKAKKPKSPKPIVIYQKDDQVALEGPNGQQVLAGQLANGNQGSYLGYYMVYLVQVTWNGTNETQTVIAGRPIIPGRPISTESAQITDLSGAAVTDNPYRPPTSPSTTQCLFQRSTTPFGGMTVPGSTTTDQQEIVSEEMDPGTEEYEDEDENDSNPKNKNKTKKKKKRKMMIKETTRKTEDPATASSPTSTPTTTV